MKNAAKRLVALLLAMSMALSLLSTTAWATNAMDELTEGQAATSEQTGDTEAPVEDEPAADEPEDVPAEAPEEDVEEPDAPAGEEENTPDDTDTVPEEEEVLNTDEEPVDEEETDTASQFRIDLSKVKFELPSYGDMLASTALKDVDEDEIKIDEDDPVMASISEELDEIVVTSEPEDAANGEDVLNGDGEGATEEKVPLTEEQKNTVLYLFGQYLKEWEENADVLGVQTPFFLMFNDNDEDGLGGLGEMLVLAGVSVEDVRSGNYGYDDLVGMIQNFTYGNQYGVEYYGETVKNQRDAALQAVKDSGATTDIQKLLVLNDWLAQEDTFDMAYIMNMGTAEMKAENEVKNEHYDTMYNVIYAEYEDSIRQQFHDQIYAGIEADLRQQYYEGAIEEIIYQQALTGYQEKIDSGEMTQEEAEAAAKQDAEQYMEANADAISKDAPGFVKEKFGEEAAAQLSAGADKFIEGAKTDGIEVDPENAPGRKMTIEEITQQTMENEQIVEIKGEDGSVTYLTANQAIPAYAQQAATGMTDGIIGYWQGSHIGALALGASVCLGYSKAYAYLVQCEFAELYTTDGDYKNASSWKKAADLYYDADGNLDVDQNYNVDMVRITFDAEVTMYGVTQDNFNSDHFWNAVKVNDKWYYIDPCYNDVYTEVMSRDRVEVTGSMNHMYFLFSDTTARSLYDGNYSALKGLYEGVATDTSYEDAWVSRIKSNTYFDGSSAYYLYDSTDVISMMDQFSGFMGGLNGSSETDMGFSSSEYKIVKHDLSAADADDGDTDYEALIEFNYKADEDDDTTVARVYNPATGEMEENELLTELFAQFQNEQTIYPSIAITMALYNDKIYFNLSNGIFSYDLETGEIVEVKEYNDVYAQRDTTVAFGGMAFTVIDESDYKEGDVHYQKVENAPIAGLTIKDDGKLYVDIATKYAYISGKSDITDSSSYGYEFQESNYNPNYSNYSGFDDLMEQMGYKKEINDNDEFMWTAVFHDSVPMSTVTGSHEYETVTVAPFCGRDGYTEERSTKWGVIKADSRVYDEGSACDHHYVHFNETYYTKDDSGNWNTGDCYVCTVCGYAVEPADDGSDDDWDETKDTYEMAKEKAGHVYSPVSDDEVKWAEDYTSATITNADLVCESCDGKKLDCLKDETITISGQTVELIDVTSKVTGTCEEGLTTTYTATGTTESGEAVSATTSVKGEAGVHNYEGTFNWAEDYSSATADLTCTVCGDTQTGVEAVVTSEEIAPTCEEDGKTTYTATATVKDADDKVIGTATDTKEVEHAALGHAYGEPEWGDWTENEEGGYSITATFTCANDPEHVVVETANGSPSVTDATCTEAGTTTYTASVTFQDKTYELPEDKVKVVTGEALGHDYTAEWKWTDDYSTASVTVTCTVCGDTKTVDAEVVKEATAPTCTEAGKNVYTATAVVENVNGNDTVTDTKTVDVPALGHAYGEPVWGEWTAKEEGGYTITATFTCANDASHVETETVDGVPGKTDATCTEAGSTTYTASVEFEGKTYDLPADKALTVTGEALGHSYEVVKWNWAEDYSSATVDLACIRGDDEQKGIVAEVTTETTEPTAHEAGKKEYTATAVYNGITYTDTQTVAIQFSLKDSAVKLSKTSYTYTGKALKPGVTVTLNGETLEADTDYTVAYTKNTNVGTATVTITGTGKKFIGSTKATFKITKASNTITASNFTKTYKTSKQTFKIGAKRKGSATLTYKSSSKKITVNSNGKVTIPAKFVGKATITITAKATDNYKKTTKKITITVNPKGTSLSSLTNVKGKKLTVKWKKNANVTGYQIQYSTSSKFTNATTVTVKNAKTLSKTISKLKKNKKYYVRIRTYKTVSGTKYKSAWSSAKSKKITK